MTEMKSFSDLNFRKYGVISSMDSVCGLSVFPAREGMAETFWLPLYPSINKEEHRKSH